MTTWREALTSTWAEAQMRVQAQSRAMPNVFNVGILSNAEFGRECHPPHSRKRVRANGAFTYSREPCFSGNRFCFHRVGELLRHLLSIRRDRFGAHERRLTLFLHAELYRIAIQYSYRKCVVVRIPGHFLIGPISFHVNFRDAAKAVVHLLVEQVFFGRAGESECVHLHLPCSVEATLRKQE